MYSKALFAAAAFIYLFSLAGCITEQDFYALDERVSALERNDEDRLSAISQRVDQIESRLKAIDDFGSDKARSLRDRLAKSNLTLGELREELRSLRGQVEETQYQVKKQQSILEGSEGRQFGRLDELEKASRQTTNRVARVEQYLNLVEAAKKPAGKSPEIQAPAVVEASTENALYRTGKQAFDNNNYETAREKFGDFLKKYPKSANADNAQFWIGETYYREKWYEKAILEYQKVIDDYPKGNKVQASLLKQGLSFLNLGEKTNSRLILKELVSKYPKSSEAAVARRKLKEIR